MSHRSRSLLVALATVASLWGFAGCGGGNQCSSGFRGSLNVCIDSGTQCGCSNASTDTCITPEMFTQNGWAVPTECTPANASYDCYNTGNGPRPCCPGYTCVAACSAGACPGESAGCVGSACIKMSSTTGGGQCMAERFTCANPNTVSPAGCLSAVLCCGSDGMCNICLGGQCGGGSMTFGPCAQGSCNNEVAAFTNYCCSPPDGGVVGPPGPDMATACTPPSTFACGAMQCSTPSQYCAVVNNHGALTYTCLGSTCTCTSNCACATALSVGCQGATPTETCTTDGAGHVTDTCSS